ncbi:MAG: M57 family metalloprotease [Patescibacteria group bacterium]
MRFPYLVALVTSIAVAGTFWYQSTAYICPAPLTYKLGQLDSHFTISRAEAIAKIAEAERAWEEKTGRELFQYEENGKLVIDFVFDDRQAESNLEGAERNQLDAQFAETETLKKTIEDLQENYKETSETYENNVEAYETALARHNEQVTRYNDQGGAPSDIHADLERERQTLDDRLNKLNADADALNKLAQNINTLGQKSNELIDAYNNQVGAYNEEYGFAKEFTQGDYQDKRINIYKFSTNEELISVLTHELGHALGIEHVADSSAVMYYLLKEGSSSVALNDADIEAFTAVCGTGGEWEFKLRQFIRNILN